MYGGAEFLCKAGALEDLAVISRSTLQLGGERTYGYIVALLAESNRGSEAANTGANYKDVERARVRHWDG
jgi:hypothetical protein